MPNSNYERCCILTDALIELAVQNYFGPGPDSTFWRARQYAIGIMQREVRELRYQNLHPVLSSGIRSCVSQGSGLDEVDCQSKKFHVVQRT